MTQKQIEFERYLRNNKIISKSTQTGDDDLLFIHLENKKIARIYYSTAYKDNVLSLNFGSSKSFIFTKQMWKVFREYVKTIDSILDN